MKVKPNYNKWHIVVEPKSAGDFGGIRTNTVKYNKKEAENLQKDIMGEILIHIDRVESVRACYESYFCGKCGSEFCLKEEAEDCCKPKINNKL